MGAESGDRPIRLRRHHPHPHRHRGHHGRMPMRRRRPMTSPSTSTSSSRSSTLRRKVRFLRLTQGQDHGVRTTASPGQPSGSRWLLGTRHLAQRCCSTRRWSAAGRSTGRQSPIASRGVLRAARRRRQWATRLGRLAHSRHLLAMTMTGYCNYVL
jgi:hypothetical protein